MFEADFIEDISIRDTLRHQLHTTRDDGKDMQSDAAMKHRLRFEQLHYILKVIVRDPRQTNGRVPDSRDERGADTAVRVLRMVFNRRSPDIGMTV